MKWIHPKEHPDIALPDIAAIVRERLENGAEFKLEHDPAAIGEMVLRQLKEKRKERPKGLASLRLSSSGSCIRRLAYDFHGIEPNGFVAEAGSVLTFATGDATEGLLTTALLEAIEGIADIHLEHVNENQQRVNIRVPLVGDLSDAIGKPWAGIPIPGHPDGQGVVPLWQKGHKTPTKVPFILEVKSMSDFGFNKFCKEGMPSYEEDGNPNGYAFQTQAYQLAKRQEGIPVEWTYLIAFGKAVSAKDAEVFIDPPMTRNNTPSKRYAAHEPDQWAKRFPVVGIWIRRSPEVQAEIVDRFQRVLLSRDPEEFDKPYGPKTAGARLRFPCDWCPHMYTCWPGAKQYAQVYGYYRELVSIHTMTPKE